MGRGLLLGAGLLLGVATGARAQGEPLAPGREVRVFVRGVVAPFEGTLLSLDRDEFTVATANVGDLTLSRALVERSEVLGSRGNAVRGGVVGLGVGLVVGIVAVVGSKDDCDRGATGFCTPLHDRVNEWLLVVPSVAGAGLGALFGSLVRLERMAPRLPSAGGTRRLRLRVERPGRPVRGPSDSSEEEPLPIGAPVPGWQPPPPPGRAAMAGRYCRLEPLDAGAHGGALHEAFRLDRAGRGWTYLPYGPFADAGAYRAWIGEVAEADDPLFFAILDASGTPVGVASYLRITPAVGSIEVGHIHYAPPLQRTRAATEAMYLMMRRAFDELGYRRYEWKCDDLNGPSRRAAERLGFVYEGTHRQARIYKGRNRDTAWYSIIDAEWPAVRRALEAWLDPANFDASGAQRAPLASPASSREA